MAIVAVAALAVRLTYIFSEKSLPISGDALFYRFNGARLGEFKGVVNPMSFEPSALHPPGWSAVLAFPHLAGFESLLQLQLFSAFIGTATVVIVGLAAARVAGPTSGLIAAAVGAIYPNFWLHERTLLSEVALLLLVAATVLVAQQHIEAPRLARAATLGGLIGALALVRPEQVLLLPILLVPLIMLAGRGELSVSQRVGWTGGAVVVALIVVAPWVVYNNLRFEEPVTLSTNFGGTVWVANCPQAYEGKNLGHIEPDCWRRLFLLSGDESENELQLRRAAVDQASANLDRLPLVLAAREGRTWGLYVPFEQADLDADFSRSAHWPYRLAVISYWLILPAVIAGVVILRRRRLTLGVLLSFVLVVVIATAMTLGQSRIRAAAEVPIVILASVAAAKLVRVGQRKPPSEVANIPRSAEANS